MNVIMTTATKFAKCQSDVTQEKVTVIIVNINSIKQVTQLT